ncbi:hypothetical protein PN836_020020 [Ningiella sp. W23]|uniref:hypothetical protein n=1 Tax=Ningiella sp. W23 TaxID=3023715 RepID=UPI0037581E46
MKKFLGVLVLALGASALVLSASSDANTIEFETADNHLESKICKAAATGGLDAAKQLVRRNGLSFSKFKKILTCNDMSLNDFAAKYSQAVAADAQPSTVQVVAKNNDRESQICLEALTIGVIQVEKKYKINSDYIRCNGKPLPKFVRQFKG